MRQICQRPGQARLGLVLIALAIANPVTGWGQAPSAGPSATARAVGTIRSISPDALTIATDSGAELDAILAPSARILRVPPGEKDLKSATPLQVQDLQSGDRVLVRGQASADGHSIIAVAVIVMKQADVSAKRERDREDWQKRGIGGLVSVVDPATGSITISAAGSGGSHKVIVRTTKETVLRRYAPGSVRFDEARPAPLDQIKPGDQLRARGTQNADHSEIAAEEVVSGTFRNIAGTITSIDAAANSLTVQDAIAKAPVIVKLSSESQIKKLPSEMAQRIAMRLKFANGEGAAAATAGQAPGAGSQGGGMGGGYRSGAGASGGQYPRGPGGMAGGGNGPPDFQRFLSRLPDSKLSDLQKGEAVMIVSTASTDSAPVTAITMLAGVEPILTASPSRGAAMMLSPWTLSGPSGEGEGGPQ